MTCDQIKEITDDSVTLIDVRTPREFNAARITGAINLPLSEIGNIKHIADNDNTLLVYCQTGKRSEYAKDILVQQGYDARNIGGIIHHLQCVEY